MPLGRRTDARHRLGTGLVRRRAGTRHRFEGEICAFGTASGHRVVIGHWPVSPFGPIADVMVEEPDGRRVLIAPNDETAAYIASTYTFDDVRVATVDAERQPDRLAVRAGDLRADVVIGGRGVLGALLRSVPRPVAASPVWATLVDPVARTVLRGVRTRGSAGGGRREWYGAHDLRRLDAVTAVYGDRDLGPMTDVVPPVRFGFGSAPRRPSIVRVTTTVALPGSSGPNPHPGADVAR